MNNLLKRYQFSRELKKLAQENLAQGKPLCIMDDIVFKTMLTSDTIESRHALRHLLSACIRREVSNVQVTNNELIPAHLDAKFSRLDVHVIFNDGEAADLEMQIDKSGDSIPDRAALYTAMLQATQSRKGHAYGEIKRVYQIFFLNCILYPHSTKLPRRYFYMEEEEHDRLTDINEIIFYEMPKLEQKVQNILTQKRINVRNLPEDEKWCIYMKYRHEEQAAKLIEKLYGTEEGIMWAEKAVAGIDRDYLKAVRKMGELKNRMDRAQMIYDAKREGRAAGHAEGLQEGRAEGLQEGRTEGHAEGRQEGLQEGQHEERQRLLEMLELGLPVEEIKRRLEE
ncbi:MAG: Rpn family recombination-promoting nuclease/putative transposase [Treponema sp.]|jgi:predicted transposase/invertase (TIGR01784 family)|nr:Rpn family recombination-promoting nuclease/putative transposase [Treponema sp.]